MLRWLVRDAMTATPEQIAAMTARGWVYDLKYDDFRCGGGDVTNVFGAPRPVIWGSLRPRGDGTWYSEFGVRGNSFGGAGAYPDPMAAADEAEAWFRHVTTGLPGLTVPAPIPPHD
jgi:hypothetical protein